MALTERYASSAGAGAHDGTTEADAWSFTEMLTNATAGHRVNFKGNHTLTASANFTNAGTTTSPIVVRGYASTITDGYLGRAAVNGPLTTTNYPVWTCGTSYVVNATAQTGIVLDCIKVTSARNDGAAYGSFQGIFIRCVFENTHATGGQGLAINTGRSRARDCDFILTASTGGSALYFDSSMCSIVGCHIDGGPGIAVAASGTGVLVRCTIKCAGGDVISYGSAGIVDLIDCTIVGESGADSGVAIPSGSIGIAVQDCLVTDCGAYGIDGAAANGIAMVMGTRTDRNTSGNLTGCDDWRQAVNYGNDATSATQANEYVNFASDDLTLKSTSPGYAANAITPERDIGASQHTDPSGGGGAATLVNGGLVG